MYTRFSINEKEYTPLMGEVIYSNDSGKLYIGGIDGVLMKVECSQEILLRLMGLLSMGYTSLSGFPAIDFPIEQYKIVCCFDNNSLYIDGEKAAALVPVPNK